MECKNIASIELNNENLKGFVTSQESLKTCDQTKFICSINALKQEILNEVYPIGAIYMNYSNNTNPKNILGFGIWEQVTDKYIYATDSTPGNGGNDYITTAMLPSHTHDFDTPTNETGAHTHDVYVYCVHESSDKSSGEHMACHCEDSRKITTNWVPTTAEDHTHTISGYTDNTGNGTAKNLPSYQSYFIWVRTA